MNGSLGMHLLAHPKSIPVDLCKNEYILHH